MRPLRNRPLNRGKTTDVYGQCNNRDNIGLELSYEF